MDYSKVLNRGPLTQQELNDVFKIMDDMVNKGTLDIEVLSRVGNDSTRDKIWSDLQTKIKKEIQQTDRKTIRDELKKKHDPRYLYAVYILWLVLN